MTNAEERKKEISDYVEGLIRDNAKIYLDCATQFNEFEFKDQIAVLQIYQIKAKGGELAALVEDKPAAVEKVAQLYHAQKCAFEDVLTKEGFEIVSEAPATYDGRIALLTNHGTFTLLGFEKKAGRLITMSRIHSPSLNIDHKRGSLTGDLRLGYSAHILGNKFDQTSSPLRALAINPHGADDDELEAAESTVLGIGEKTAMILMRPREEPAYR